MAPSLQVRRFAGVVLGLSALLIIISVWQRPKRTEFRPECPLSNVRFQHDSSHDITSRLTLAGAGTHTLVPEFNDCQRFVNKGETAYGPLVGIFANENLNDQIDRMYRLANDSNPINAVSVALILDFGDAGYPDLGISRAGNGFNCLYMAAKFAGVDTTLTAYVQWVADDADCAQDQLPAKLEGTGKALKVYSRVPRIDYAGYDYPQVARWDWDTDKKLEYIGIGCKYAWCEIGNPPLKESPRYAGDPASPRAVRRVREVKGWYDEEVLALDGGSGTLVPSHTIGTLIPDPGLDTLLVKHFDNKWQPVAEAAVQGPPLTYKKKLNFEVASVESGRTNTIELCKGDAGCIGTATVDTKACVNQPDDPWTNNHWWARITPAGNSSAAQYRCVLRRAHPNVAIPGMVRWRWKNNDQVAWIKCDAGCCEVTGLK